MLPCHKHGPPLLPPCRLGTPIGETARRSGSHTSTEGMAPHRTPSIGLAQRFLVLITALANVVWLAILAPLSYIGTLSPLSSWLLPCSYFKAFTPLSFRPACSILSPSSPEETPANSTHREPGAPSNPKTPHRLLSGGTPVPIAEDRLPSRSF